MRQLVIVHTENEYLDSSDMSGNTVRMNANLFERIAIEIDRVRRMGWHVCYLPGNGAGLNETYPAIKRQLGDATIIPNSMCVEEQFLRTKRRFMTQQAGDIALCGLSYYSCVSDLYKLLIGINTKKSERDYAIFARYMGWTDEFFKKIFNERLNARILENLTDKD